MGKPPCGTLFGSLGEGSLPQEGSGQGHGGAGCIGCITPCHVQGLLGGNQGCCSTGSGHPGCLLHQAPPGCCPWRAMVMNMFGATRGCGELCPGFGDLLGRLLLARWGSNEVGLATHPLGGCLGSHRSTGGEGGRSTGGDNSTSSDHERQSTPTGDLFSESPQKAVSVVSKSEAERSCTAPWITSPSRAGLPRHPTAGGEESTPGTKGLFPSVPSSSSTNNSSPRKPSLPRRTVNEQAELGAREQKDNSCSNSYDVKMYSHVEEIVPSDGVAACTGRCGTAGRCNAPNGDLSESPQKAASTDWGNHSIGVDVTLDDDRDVDHIEQESNVGKEEFMGRVLRSDQNDVEVEVVGRVQSLPGGQHSPEVRWLVDTGATRSILSASTYRRALSHIPLRPVHVPMTAINGSRVPVMGACTLVIILNGRRYKHDFIVAEIGDEGVLGRDFLRANRCQWNWEHNVLEIDGQEIRCRVPLLHDIPTEEVRAVKTYVIPARTEMVIEGQRGEGTRTLSTGMLTGLPRFMGKRQLGVAAILARRRGTIVPVRVLNPSSRKRTVVIGDALASYQAVEVLEPRESMKGRAVRTREGSAPLTPELEDLYERGTEELSHSDKGRLRSLLEEFSDIFSSEGKPLGRTGVVKHTIHTGDHRAIRQPPRRAPLGQESVVQEELEKMLLQGVIESSSSAWASPVVLVKKKDGSVRFCVDYRRLNDITEKDAYPLPRVDDNLDALAGAKVFSTLDLTSGYWQVEMDPEDAGKTAFCTRYGLYQWRVMPFGLCNAPSTFERLMEKVLAGLQWKIALLYLDDVIVFSSTVEQQLDRLRLVFERLRKANLQLKPKKCHLFCKEVSFLGHRVSGEGVTTEEDKVKAVKEWPVPKSVKAVRSFLGLTGYYRRFVKDYAAVASPLIALTQKAVTFKWGDEEQRAFDALKDKLVTAPILGYPDTKEAFILDTDASKCAIGAVLSQVQDGKEVVIAYGSRRLTKSERNYCVTRQELLAIVWFTEHFKHYLIGKKFLLRTDHGSLRWLFRFKEPEGQMARWLERLARFDFDIEHRPGVKHGNSDGLSRVPCEGHCKNCLKGHEMAVEEETVKKTPGIVRAVRTATRRTRGRTERQRRQKAATMAIPNEWMVEIKQWQEADPDLQVLETWAQRPSWGEIARERAEIKYYWSKWNQLKKEGGIWYYQWREAVGDGQWKAIVPPVGRASILREHHDSRIAGHFGLEKTLSRLRQSPYFWPKMRTTVEDWCKECAVCARTKAPNRKVKAPMQSVGAGVTLERVGIDVMGPLPETDKGNRFVLVIGDYWTKWMEAYPIPDHTASTVASVLVYQFISRFGIPQQIHSDQGREFEARLFQEMCELLQVDKTRTTPWRPCSNGLVENFNRTLGAMLRQMTSKHQRDWDEHIDLATMAYRSTVHESTGQTPNRMMLGRELPMPSHLLVETPEPDKSQDSTDLTFVARLEKQLHEAHELAREQLKKSHVHQKKEYDRGAHTKEWSVGKAVWLFNPTKQLGKSPKLTIFWEEDPYIIIEKVNDVVMKIQKGRRHKPRVVHVDRLKLVTGPVDTSWYTGTEPSQGEGGRHGPADRGPQATVTRETGLQ